MKFHKKIKRYKWLIKILVAIVTVSGATIYISFGTNIGTNNSENANSDGVQINGGNISNVQVKQDIITSQVIQRSEYDIDKQKITDTAKTFVTDFYQTLNNRDYDKIARLYHKTFTKDNEVKIYFSRERWKNFMECIDKNIQVVKIEPLEIWDVNNETKNRRGFHYWIKYFIKEREFEEDWEMVWVDFERGGNFRLAKLECKTKNCSSAPFFNQEKYCK